MENASFVIDIDVVNFEDLNADDLGYWSLTGTKKSYIGLSSSGALRVSDKRPSTNQTEYYTIQSCRFI